MTRPASSRSARAGQVSERERSVLASLASQLSTAIENARLYEQLDGLFRSYLSPEVAASLLADPGRAALGGTIHEVTILMADLQGFTPFSERSSPTEVIEMLNTYWGVTVPVILAEGGTITQFVGDAVMALFGAPAAQPDHARRAARAALALQSAAAGVLADHPDWPRFRVGLNTGPAIVGNVAPRICATSPPSATRRTSRRGWRAPLPRAASSSARGPTSCSVPAHKYAPSHRSNSRGRPSRSSRMCSRARPEARAVRRNACAPPSDLWRVAVVATARMLEPTRGFVMDVSNIGFALLASSPSPWSSWSSRSASATRSSSSSRLRVAGLAGAQSPASSGGSARGPSDT